MRLPRRSRRGSQPKSRLIDELQRKGLGVVLEAAREWQTLPLNYPRLPEEQIVRKCAPRARIALVCVASMQPGILAVGGKSPLDDAAFCLWPRILPLARQS